MRSFNHAPPCPPARRVGPAHGRGMEVRRSLNRDRCSWRKSARRGRAGDADWIHLRGAESRASENSAFILASCTVSKAGGLCSKPPPSSLYFLSLFVKWGSHCVAQVGFGFTGSRLKRFSHLSSLSTSGMKANAIPQGSSL